jgi:tRNA pseudouridine38-40 synthase
MRNIRLTVAYDGTDYHGWQCQPKVRTVEETLRERIEKVLDHPVKLYAAGRTDAGVHALRQVVNLRTERAIPCDNFVLGVNSLLPKDVRLHEARDVDENFHARYSARNKSYLYIILNQPHASPFLERYAWHVPWVLDGLGMARALDVIVGVHDFSAFKKKNEMYRSAVREVVAADVKRRGAIVYCTIRASGFLRYMVRNIVGTLVLVGLGRLSRESVGAILSSREREQAGPTAPAKGLFLRRIYY